MQKGRVERLVTELSVVALVVTTPLASLVIAGQIFGWDFGLPEVWSKCLWALFAHVVGTTCALVIISIVINLSIIARGLSAQRRGRLT